MACFHPITGYRSESVNPGSGKRSIVFDRRKASYGGVVGEPQIACGQCIGCRLERSRQWAIRCVHEAQLHERNCFITLTYDNDHLPSGGTLVKKHFQDFMKSLRHKVSDRIRYFHCGEYGEKFGRPHYHAIMFGFDFPDKRLWRISGGEKLYVSEMLSETWGKGHCSVGSVSFDSAAYVARYCVKKITGSEAESHYQGRLPEYTTMSRRPGIGKGWFDKYSGDAFPSDSILIRGKEMKVPRYYDRVFEIENPEEFAKVKELRKATARVLKDGPENSYERRMVREEHARLTLIQSLQRKFENGNS